MNLLTELLVLHRFTLKLHAISTSSQILARVIAKRS